MLEYLPLCWMGTGDAEGAATETGGFTPPFLTSRISRSLRHLKQAI
jgi:hypothetical protein